MTLTSMAKARLTEEWLAGGTDVLERRRSGVLKGVVRRLVPTPEMTAITWGTDGRATIGAMVSVASLASDTRIASAYPGLAQAAGGLATPEIRAMATLGGNLAQKSRCWYYRDASFDCFKKGGNSCPARSGNHRNGVAFDTGACVHPHASTLAVALMAYDATVTTDACGSLDIAALVGDGRDGRDETSLSAGDVIRTVAMPAPMTGERAIYKRAIARAEAEWPLVEIVVRLVEAGGRVVAARIVVGGVAPVPLRLIRVESALTGAALGVLPIREAQRIAIEGAKPMPMTGYKLALLQGLLADTIESLEAP